ncbi:hypothetical protein AH03_13 [Erwinia phage AH03]|uniref:Uncharacterized protein n=1 Tax=Erwinia phage AH03 TaxID=2869568 RepID=A0AAE8BUF2_9CAUD|nr:hypothetical protein AH03_13 [Erwinia phage AH03]
MKLVFWLAMRDCSPRWFKILCLRIILKRVGQMIDKHNQQRGFKA